MRLLFSLIFLIGGLCGMAISLLGEIVVSSTMFGISDLELSIWLGLFSFVAFLSGLYNMVSNN